MELLNIRRFSLLYFSFHDDPNVYFLVDERSELQAGQFNLQPHAALKLEYTFLAFMVLQAADCIGINEPSYHQTCRLLN